MRFIFTCDELSSNIMLEEFEQKDFNLDIQPFNVMIVPTGNITKVYDGNKDTKPFLYDVVEAVSLVDATTLVEGLLTELGDLAFTYESKDAGEWLISLTEKTYKNLKVTLKENTIGTITKVSKGKLKTAKSYKWAYYEEK